MVIALTIVGIILCKMAIGFIAMSQSLCVAKIEVAHVVFSRDGKS